MRTPALTALLLAVLPCALPAQATREDSARAVHLLERATWGVKRDELAAVLAMGPDAWLDRQLHPARIADGALAARLARFPAAEASPAELMRDYPRRPAAADSARRGMPPQRILADLAGARLQRAVYTERQLEDVMADFWFNHFNVFFGKGADRYLVGDYERNAIRPHVFGRFRELLGAVAAHPAMLVYLDNARSSAADSSRVMMGGRARGINENYARELMELHTLGVGGGYTQRDVGEVARAFTGWTVGRRNGAPGFVFRRALHDAGPKTVLGERLAAGRGVEDGEAVLDLLARNPATARHLARKLAARFVADDPPARLVDELASVFLRTDGDLRAVTRALFRSPEFARARRAKTRTPFEFVAGALRATGADVRPSRDVIQTLRQMRHLPYAATPPTGYLHSSAEWTSGGAMLGRMNFALALARGEVRGIRIDPARLLPPGAAGDPARHVAAALLPTRDADALVRAVSEDAARLPAEARAARALALILASPSFQRH